MNKDLRPLQNKVKSISEVSSSRVTIILPNGKVISDSSFNFSKMENHIDRDEVKQAILGQVGEALRHSPTLGEDFLYIAVPLYSKSGELVGVLRNSVSVSNLQDSLSNLTRKVLIWSLLLLFVLTYFIYAQAKKISAPLELIKKHVEHFSLDELEESVLLGQSNTEEIDSLFRSVKKMSIQLRSQFVKISKQRNEMNAVFTSMIEGVITILPDLTVYHINRSALNLFDYPADNRIKGTPLSTIIENEEILNFAKKLLSHHNSLATEVKFGDKTLEIHGSMLDLDDNSLQGAVLVFDDITKMRELETHRTEFVANVSHELKTPLTVIQGYVETLKEEDIDDKETRLKFMTTIERHTIRLKAIVEDLLALSSLEKESSLGNLELAEVSIKKLLSNVIELCRPRAKAKNILIECNCVDAIIKVAPSLIEQAIMNLLDNAIKYGPENTEVSLLTYVEDDYITITVSDKGQGIAPHHLPRLFERFYSVDKARSRELGGSGLGLSIVKHIALSHGGEVDVKSEIGIGTQFIFKIPILLTNS